MAWYNKYRPQQFADVAGQKLVKSVLQNSIEKDRVKNAYLLYGPKGVGKTTLARIFASQLNNIDQNPEAQIDLIEMDAASNTSIDDVRQLIESAKTPPLSGKYKIYIIDEVHMLSKAAMNALLKILEEPPVYLVFLLATTNPEKLLPTVLSRLTRLNLNSHSIEDILEKLKSIAELEKVNIDQASLTLVAKRSSGSMRDAINLLETVASYELDSYTITETSQLLGLLPQEILNQIATTLVSQGMIESSQISELENTGVDGETFLGQFLDFLLSQSLQGDSSYSEIILAVAEVLNLKLPVTSTSSSIALIQAKLLLTANRQNGSEVKKKSSLDTKSITPQAIAIEDQGYRAINTTTAANLNNNSTTTANSVNESILADEIELDTPVSQSQTKTSQQLEELTEKNKHSVLDSISENRSEQLADKQNMEAADSNSDDIQQSLSGNDFNMQEVLSKVLNSSDAPPILKMMINDLSIEASDSQKISLGISNAIFQSQLGSPKLNLWLSDKFKLELGKTYKIEAIVRQSNKPIEKVVIERKLLTNNLSEQKTQYSPVKKIKLTAKKELPAGIFYEVYNQLPVNADSDKLKVFNSPIPKPAFNKDWDDHAGELFDFED